MSASACYWYHLYWEQLCVNGIAWCMYASSMSWSTSFWSHWFLQRRIITLRSTSRWSILSHFAAGTPTEAVKFYSPLSRHVSNSSWSAMSWRVKTLVLTTFLWSRPWLYSLSCSLRYLPWWCAKFRRWTSRCRLPSLKTWSCLMACTRDSSFSQKHSTRFFFVTGQHRNLSWQPSTISIQRRWPKLIKC